MGIMASISLESIISFKESKYLGSVQGSPIEKSENINYEAFLSEMSHPLKFLI